jgi:hypothetical protein
VLRFTQHRCSLAKTSDGELVAALATARGKDGTAGPGTHPLTEAVDLRPPTVVRLERALAHWNSQYDPEIVVNQRQTYMRRVVRLGPDVGQAAVAGGTWVSLLTVKAIPAQVKLNDRGAVAGDPLQAATCPFPGLPSGNTAISTTETPSAT